MDYDYVIDDFFTHSNDAFFGGLAIFFIILFIIIGLICLVATVLTVIGKWKVLEKAKQPGWAALIPYYNTFKLCNITGVRPLWVIISFVFTVGCNTITSILNALHLNPFFGLISTAIGTLSFAIAIYFSILLNVSLAKSFGKEDSFAIGLILLPPIFYLMLGTDSSKYLGPKPMDDKIYEFVNSKVDLSCFGSLNKSSATKETKGEFIKKCQICGTKNPEKAKFCSVCGSKL